MAQVKLPWVDTNALAERLRDVDLSRLAELGDELRKLDVAEGIRQIDVDALKRLDLDGLRHLAEGIERPEVDLPDLAEIPGVRQVQRMLGMEPKPNLWRSLTGAPPAGATIIAGAVIVLAGAALGAVLAWLYQPGKGEQRRTRLRRRLKRFFGELRGSARR